MAHARAPASLIARGNLGLRPILVPPSHHLPTVVFGLLASVRPPVLVFLPLLFLSISFTVLSKVPSCLDRSSPSDLLSVRHARDLRELRRRGQTLHHHGIERLHHSTARTATHHSVAVAHASWSPGAGPAFAVRVLGRYRRGHCAGKRQQDCEGTDAHGNFSRDIFGCVAPAGLVRPPSNQVSPPRWP